MESKQTGYVIINSDLPTDDERRIVIDSFRYSEEDAKTAFIHETGLPWKYFHDKWNFRCVKAEVTIKILDNEK